MRCNITVSDLELLPIYAHFGDAGADLKASNAVQIRPGEVVKVGTGVCISIPYGFAGFLMSRSGHGKLKVSLANSVGLIDHQYTGEIMALVTNDGMNEYNVKQFERIAQLVIVPVMMPTFNIVDTLQETDRGSNGFGSSGT